MTRHLFPMTFAAALFTVGTACGPTYYDAGSDVETEEESPATVGGTYAGGGGGTSGGGAGTTPGGTTGAGGTQSGTSTGGTSGGADCTWSGFNVAGAYAWLDDADPTKGLFVYQAYNTDSGPYDLMEIQSYQGAPYNGPSEPGLFSLDGTNFADCGLCVMLFADCDEGYCDKVFYADEGEVEVVEMAGVGEPFDAILHDVVLKEVRINETTWESTPIPGGETWCLDGHSLSAVPDRMQ